MILFSYCFFFFSYPWTVMKQHSVKNNYSSKLMWPLPMLTNIALELCQYPETLCALPRSKLFHLEVTTILTFEISISFVFLYGFTTDGPIPKQHSLVLPVLVLLYYVCSFVVCCFCSVFVRSIHVVTYSSSSFSALF